MELNEIREARELAKKILEPLSDKNAWTIHPDELELLAKWALENDGPPAYLSEALNSGDGAYRP